MTRPTLAEALRLRELAKIGAYEEHRRMMCEHADGYWDGNAYHSSEADTCPHHDCVLVRAFSSVEASPQDEEVVVAMLAACEAVFRHLWDIAGRFESKECNAIRDEIHILNTITLPSIRDLEKRLTPAAPALRGEASPPPICVGVGHVWTNQFGDDWTPEKGASCDCGQKQWNGSGCVAARVPVVSEDSK